ncbi:DNA binding protein [Aureococcus anophagefferens]|uniref:DNA binding protein n=1 Tax=Aureococcus anophagefferens TaxID=44056 RepID=A0ABR1GBM7_AURAN
MRNRRGQPDVVADNDDDAEEERAPTASNLANPLSVAAHILVFFLAIGAGRYARLREASAPPLLDGEEFVQALLETPQQLLLVATRLQVDRFPRGDADDARRTLGGALDVDEALAASPTLAALWRSREVPDAGAFRDGAASTARAVVDEYFVDLAAKSAFDGATATAALGYAAWLGLPRACAALVARGGDVGFAGGLGRSPLHAAAASATATRPRRCSGPRGARGAEGPRRWRDALGLSPKALAAKAARGTATAPPTRRRGVDRFPGAWSPTQRGAPVLVRGLGRNWTARKLWHPAVLATRDDVDVQPHPIPHGESFGVARAASAGDARRLRAVLGAGPAAVRRRPRGARRRRGPAGLRLRRGRARRRSSRARTLGELRKLLAPSAAVDALLDGLPGRLHGAHGGSDQFYCGPAGSGAPLHYHEHAVNFLAHGSKTWWLLPPADAVYSVAHPATWRAPPAGALACVQRAGDVLFAPANWAHAVRNDEPAVGVAVEFPDVFMIHHMNAHMLGYDVAGDRGVGGDDDDRGDGDGDQQGGGDDDPGAALLAEMIPA